MDEHSFNADLWNNYAAVLERISLGQKAMTNVSSHLKTRAKIHEVFSQSLTKLATSDRFDEKGTAGEAWKAVKGQGEDIGKEHCDLARTITGTFLTEILAYEKDKKLAFANLTAEASKWQKDLDKAKADWAKAKAKFEKTSKEMDKTEETWEKKEGDGKTLPPALDKLFAKWGQLKEQAAADDEAYKSSIENFNQIQQTFRDEMDRILAKYEKLEEERLDFAKTLLLRFLDAVEQMMQRCTAQIGGVRKSVEDTDVRSDLNAFIIDKKIDGDRPPEVEYEPYVSTFAQDHESKIGPTDPETHPMPVKGGKKEKKGKKAKTDEKTSDDFVGAASGAAAASIATASAPVAEAKHIPAGQEMKARAVYPFNGEDGELSFQIEDIINVTAVVDGGWWEGTFNGKSGSFPGNYVEILKDEPKADAAVPPPPPADAVDDGKAKKKCKVIYAYPAESSDELSCAEEEILSVDHEVGEWLICINDKGQSGMVPKNYVQILE